MAKVTFNNAGLGPVFQEGKSMTSEEIDRAIVTVCKKAAGLVGLLSDPSAYHHLIYEQARFHLSHLVGKDSLHGEASHQDQGLYEQAVDLLDNEIRKALAEAVRRH